MRILLLFIFKNLPFILFVIFPVNERINGASV